MLQSISMIRNKYLRYLWLLICLPFFGAHAPGEEDAAPEERLSVQSGKGDGHLDLKTLNSSSRRKVDMSVMDTGLGSMSFWQS